MHVSHEFKRVRQKYWPKFSLTAAVTIFIVVVCATVIAIDSWASLTVRAAKIREAEAAALNLARGMAQHANDTLQATDVVLTELVERQEALDGPGPIGREERLQKVLQERASNLPYLSRLGIIDEQGVLRLRYSRAAHEGPASVAEREYFTFHRDNPERGAFLGKMIRARSDGTRLITLSRRLNRADGSFAGVVMASISLAYFEKYHGSLDIGKEGMIVMAQRDGSTLVRWPALPGQPGNIGLLTARQLATPFGTQTARSADDGVERLAAHVQLEDFPLTVVVALSKREVLAGWWNSMYLHTIFVLLLTASLGFIGMRLVRQIRIRVAAESALQGSERRWMYALEGIGDGLWDWNNRTGEVQYSKQWKAMLGYADTDIASDIGERQNRVHLDDLAAATQAFDAYANGAAEAYAVEARMLCKDHSWRWVLSRGVIVERDSQGRPLRTIGTHIDITARKQTEQALKVSEERHRLMVEEVRATIDALSAQICVLDEAGTILAVNQAWRDFHAADPGASAHFGPGSRYRILCAAQAEAPAEAATRLAAGIAATLRAKSDSFECEYAYQTAQGQHWFRVTVTRLSGAAPKVVLAHENITALKLAEIDLRLSSTVYRALGEAIMVLDPQDRIVAINPAFTQFTGYVEGGIIGQSMRALQAHQPQVDFEQRMQQMLDKTGHWQGKIWLRRQDGSIALSWLTLDTIYDDDGRVRQRVGMYSKVTDYKLAEQTIWEQANFDALTGLPNRSMFQDRLDQELKKSHRHGSPLALLFIDLDRFKDINDTLGHDVGDVLLEETARRLLGCVRAADTVARLGGDEFTVILSDLASAANAALIAQEILKSLALPFLLGSEKAFISASIGITMYPDDADRVDALLKNADQAMYAAKNQGRNRYKFFTSSMQQAAQARMRTVNDLRSALANGEFRVVYQPIVTLSTGRIAKAEALIRWQHPERGLVNPIDFIGLAEETGMIVDIGNWVFAEVTQQVKRWRALHDEALQISVNISPAQFRGQSERHGSWLDYLALMDVPGPCIGVEITEGMLMEASGPVTKQLHQFREAGMHVSLDDFGTGYSSLSYLKKFDIDTLKIDQSFVRNMTPGSDDLALCEAIIVMAHKLGIQVVAEGVETREQCSMLTTAGCDFGQGFLFSRPVSSGEFSDIWQQRCDGELAAID